MVTYSKLKSGEWGIRGPLSEIKGRDTVNVVKKSGDVKTEKVVKILWSDNTTALAAIAQRDSNSSGSRSGKSRGRGTWTGCSCGSVEEYERDSDCDSCRHDR